MSSFLHREGCLLFYVGKRRGVYAICSARKRRLLIQALLYHGFRKLIYVHGLCVVTMFRYRNV